MGEENGERVRETLEDGEKKRQIDRERVGGRERESERQLEMKRENVRER